MSVDLFSANDNLISEYPKGERNVCRRWVKARPYYIGMVLGWGVVRNNPWHLAGVYTAKESAEAEASKLGNQYEIHYGSHRLGSDDFVWDSIS
ncbi:TPA: hypothetical protein PXP53_004274 [Yersinia enterocolitica]|nr:hypothetical protein [Yersinia enterocolitica]